MSEIDSFSPGEKRNEGFTLLELLIVILLLSVMTTLIVGNLSRQKSAEMKTRITQIKTLRKKLKEGEGELLCLDECRQCYLRDRGRKIYPIATKFRKLDAYTMDSYNEAQKIDFGRFKDRKICLRFRFRSNGSTSRLIVGSGEKFYFIPSYFGDVQTFTSLEEAKAFWLKNSDLLHNEGDYY